MSVHNRPVLYSKSNIEKTLALVSIKPASAKTTLLDVLTGEYEGGVTMKAFIVMMVLSAVATAVPTYQVFATSEDAIYADGTIRDHYADGVWGESSFEQAQDITQHDDYVTLNPGTVFEVEFSFPLNSGDPQDLWFVPGQTYSVRFARGESWDANPLQLWSSVYNFTVPVSISSSWQDSLSTGIQGVRWRRENIYTLRLRVWYHQAVIDYAFMVLEIPGTQELSSRTWANIKTSL